MLEYSNKKGKANDAALWHERVDGLLNSTELIFFFGNDVNDKVMIEVACESVTLCDVDQQSFKAYLSRWMAATTKWAPWTFNRIKRLLQNSAQAAVKQCTGGANGRMCGMKWANNSGLWDGTTGVGQQMAVMEVVLANMIHEAKPPVTNLTGGTSVGNPSAGGEDSGRIDSMHHFGPIKTGDRAGAAFATFVALSSLLAAVVFLFTDETKTDAVSSDSSAEGDTAAGDRNAAQQEKRRPVVREQSLAMDSSEQIQAIDIGASSRPQPGRVQGRGRVRKPPSTPSPPSSPDDAVEYPVQDMQYNIPTSVRRTDS